MTRLRSFAAGCSAIVLALGLGACAYFQSEPYGTPPPGARVGPGPGGPAMPASIPADDLIGNWGFTSYHNPADRVRTEAAARGQCRQPYVIARGPSGGVMMHLADSSQPVELRLKGGTGGKNYVGPDGPAGDPRDREIISHDGRTMVLRWVDPELSSRYGTLVYARCGAPGTRPKVAAKAKRKRPPGPPPAVMEPDDMDTPPPPGQ